MLDQIQYSLISPFFHSYAFKTGVHWGFYREILKVIQIAYGKDIFDFLNKTVKPIQNK